MATSLSRAPHSVDLSDREHIRVHLTGDYKGLFVGKPVLGRVSGQPTIQVSERVEDADGKLLGVLVFSLSPEFLTPLHRAVNLGKTGSMILAGEDGVIIDNPDLDVITPAGGERRKANTIVVGDTIKLKKQLTFFPKFLITPRAR